MVNVTVDTADRATTRFRGELWTAAESTYGRILEHPFLSGLTSGELDPVRFRFYVVQDSHYLRHYARALSVLAARAPEQSTAAMFAAHAGGAIAVEQELHAGFLAELGAVDTGHEPGHEHGHEPATPTTVAYTSYLLAVTQGGSFAEGLAAVLPCYWIYWEVGKALAQSSSPDPLYARWIDTYAGEQFAESVRAVLDLTDRVGPGVPAAERARMIENFVTAAKFEWMFWDAAYRRESWPV